MSFIMTNFSGKHPDTASINDDKYASLNALPESTPSEGAPSRDAPSGGAPLEGDL